MGIENIDELKPVFREERVPGSAFVEMIELEFLPMTDSAESLEPVLDINPAKES